MQASSEDEHLEFKAARSHFEVSKLIDYCVALSNEGGGHLVLGVTDTPPREIVGTSVFRNIVDTKEKIFNKLHRRVDIFEIDTASGRVLSVFSPPAPPGHPISVDGRFLMRIGEGLTGMSGDRLRDLLLQGGGDPSATLLSGSFDSLLDSQLIARFRSLAVARCQRHGDAVSLRTALTLESCSDVELLENVYLTMDGSVTWAALVMLGGERGLARHLPQAELIFEYRSADVHIDYQERRSFRSGFLGYMDEVWATISKRNEVQAFQAGLLRHQIPTLSERSVREALLNAVCHRSYFDQGSVIVKQFPRRLEVFSPGGFPRGVTAENILTVSRPRNRLLHEGMERCGLVERSGQGADLMFSEAIRAGKHVPSYLGSDQFSVFLTLNGQVRDSSLMGVLEQIQKRLRDDLDILDLRVIDAVFHNEDSPDGSEVRIGRLVEQGILERAARGRLVLARSLYAALGQKGVYTRRKGLAHETEKALLLQHIKENQVEGSPMRDLVQAMPNLHRYAINALLDELRRDGKVHVRGQRRVGRWFPGPIEEKELDFRAKDSKTAN
ncbi:ATP-binding protein [Lichenicoccus sp.]|uniref:ATP-binding protein n=1 Tax=Lichenicoccus sp. TaxID=2781899 RepID=UPI003D0B5D26